jgi:hypothetical protein
MSVFASDAISQRYIKKRIAESHITRNATRQPWLGKPTPTGNAPFVSAAVALLTSVPAAPAFLGALAIAM